MLSIGDRIPEALFEVDVIARSGERVKLGTLWGDGPVLMLFLRHFGCVGCSMNVTDLAPRLYELHQLGMKAIFIGNGSPWFMEAFIEDKVLGDKKVEVVTDPSLHAYVLAGMIRSMWSTFGPRAAWDLVSALGKGHINTLIKGDLLQQGGAIILDAQRQVVFYHQNQSLADHAPSVDLIDAAMRLLIERTPEPARLG